MEKILVFAETHNNELKRSAQELLTAARSAGAPFAAVVSGTGAAGLVATLGKWGAAEVHTLAAKEFDAYNSELFAAGLADVIAKSGATLVLGAASSVGRDLFPRVAARLNAGLISDCTGLNLAGEVTARKPLYAGKAFATQGFSGSGVKMILMRPNQLPVGQADANVTAQAIAHSVPATDLRTLVKEIVKGTTEKLDLTEANIIVSGGRGLKEAGNFKLLEQLAEVLGATVGASRAVVDAGWVPHDMQVGQTGKTVAPTLYIAVGISGAIQHLAGMSGSKVIVAVNTDAAAPIFQKATYGIVGDFATVVPALTEEFRKLLH